jgi:diguanylate cyclase (GGDEF)-like protein/PAS domain S-box-containing protein
MIDLITLHRFLASHTIVTLLGPFSLLVAIVLAAYYLRISRRLGFQIALQKQTDVMLRKLSSAVENSSASIVITDSEGIIEYVNPAFSLMTGYAQDEALGQGARILKCGDQPEDFYRTMWETLMRGETWRGEFHNKRKDGSLFWESASISPITDGSGNISHFVAIKENITDNKMMLEQLEHLACFDMLTGLTNRRVLLEHLVLNVEIARRNGQRFAFMYIDLDGFKQINDTHGHEAGDLVLKTAATRLRDSVRVSDTVGRMGGDEFTVVLGTINQHDDAGRVADKILETLRLPIALSDGTIVRVDASIGISVFPDDAGNSDQLLAIADSAMYEVKHNGKGGYRFSSQHNIG